MRNAELKIGYVLSREKFVEVIDGLRDREDAARELNKFLRSRREFSEAADFFSGEALVSSNTQTVIDVLGAMFGDDETIGYFCFEIDYGRNWQPGMVLEGGRDIPMRDAGELYDYLVSRL